MRPPQTIREAIERVIRPGAVSTVRDLEHGVRMCGEFTNLQNHAALALGFVKAHAAMGHSGAAIIAEGLADALGLSLGEPFSKPEPHEPGVPA
jgi:hypothetical protein